MCLVFKRNVLYELVSELEIHLELEQLGHCV
jgi:hypothetical protein